MCHTPILLGQLELFFNNLTMKYTPKIRGRRVRLMLSKRVLAQWRRLVAFMKATNLLYRATRATVPVPAHHHGHKNGQQSGHMLHRCFICCCPGSRRGNTECVVAQWPHPVDSGVALVMLHWTMPCVLLQCNHMAIEMACNEGTFVCCSHLFHFE